MSKIRTADHSGVSLSGSGERERNMGIRKLSFLGLALLLVLAGCRSAADLPLAKAIDSLAIEVADGVAFLPPIGSGKELTGNFDPDVPLSFEIFEMQNGDAIGESIGPSFSTAHNTIKVTNNPSVEEQYHVNWNSKQLNLPSNVTTTLRIEVRLSDLAQARTAVCNDGVDLVVGCLAYADVRLLPNRGRAQAPRVVGSGEDRFIELVNGQTLPIKVHVEEGAIAVWPMPTFTVDSTLTPTTLSLPGLVDATPRVVASVVDDNGNQADFVENEVIVVTDNIVELTAFLTRWEGEVLDDFDPSDFGLDGLKPQYLIRIRTDSADTSRLVADLRTLEPNSTGAHRISTEDALQLLAAAAHEAVNGLSVSLNWVGVGTGFRSRTTTEAPIVDAQLSSSSNAFDWDYLRGGGIQDIGVTEVWRALDFTGKLSNKVKIAILDMGFAPDPDFPLSQKAFSVVPGVADKDVPNTPNRQNCGSPCPWHGTTVLHAAMGVPDNIWGAAGPAGPIAEAIMIYTEYTQ
jgi:hypothetical protein